MRIFSRRPPLYVWPNLIWYNEREKKEYVADIESLQWVSGDKTIAFPSKTEILK
jgi:hypothetical protein